jgi:hypothetical protein
VPSFLNFILVQTDEVSGEIPETSVYVIGLSQALILMHPSDRPPRTHYCQMSLGPFQYASLSEYDPFPSVGARMKRREFLGFLGGVAPWPSLGLAGLPMLLARDDQVIE